MVDPNETPETRAKHERFLSYRRGWKNGACTNARDPRFTDHAREDLQREYARGYDDGVAAMHHDAVRAAERLDYDPRLSVLRSAAKDAERLASAPQVSTDGSPK